MLNKQYELQDVSLWPNHYSLDENLQMQQTRIRNLITSTKQAFFLKNEKQLKLESIVHLLDGSRDVYYPPKTNEPSYCKAGLHYSIPDNVVGIGLNIDPAFQNQQEWAVMYHGTKPQHLEAILKGGLKAGGGQAHMGTKDPWGQTVPSGVYFSFWLNQAMNYTTLENPIVLECFVNKVFVAPNFKGYAVSNSHRLSRVLIPLKKDRKQQFI